MPTSVVSGGAGFLGSHLCDYLLAKGHRVICIDNLDTGSLQNIEHLKNGEDFLFENHDVTEPFFLAERIEIDRAVNDFGSAVLGTAYQWIMQAYPIDMAQEMAYVRARLIRDYGAPSPR